jgi:predicted phage-related endonuclease
MVTILDIPQRSDEWRRARCGRLTSTSAADMLAQIKKGEAAARRNLRTRLVCERLTQQPIENGYQSAEMKRGIELESVAIAAYEADTGTLTRSIGFLAHPDLLAGCSPDAIVGDFAGVVEVKCPNSATHLEYLRGQTVPSDYVPQVQHALWLSGARWCDFVSYDPRFPPALQLFITRLHAHQVDLKAYELLVRMFLSEVDREYDEVAAMMAAVEDVA